MGEFKMFLDKSKKESANLDLKIRSVYTNVNGDSRVVIDVVAMHDVNLHSYIIHDETFDSDGSKSNVFQHFYRFPAGAIAKPGSIVRLFSRVGSDHPNGRKFDGDESLYYDFFWGSNASVWNENDKAHLLKVSPIDSKQIQDK